MKQWNEYLCGSTLYLLSYQYISPFWDRYGLEPLYVVKQLLFHMKKKIFSKNQGYIGTMYYYMNDNCNINRNKKKEFFKKGYYYASIHKRISYTSFFGHFRYKIAVYCYKLINLMGSAKFYARTDNASNFWKFFLLYIVRLKGYLHKFNRNVL